MLSLGVLFIRNFIIKTINDVGVLLCDIDVTLLLGAFKKKKPPSIDELPPIYVTLFFVILKNTTH